MPPVESAHLPGRLDPGPTGIHLLTSCACLMSFYNDWWHLRTAILHVTFGKEMLLDPEVVSED